MNAGLFVCMDACMNVCIYVGIISWIVMNVLYVGSAWSGHVWLGNGKV